MIPITGPRLSVPHAPVSLRRRVLHVTTHLQLGGAERIVLDLATRLPPEFEAAVFAVHLGKPDAFGAALRATLANHGVTLGTGTRLAIKRGGLAIAAWRLARFIGRWRPDVVHLHTEIPEATYAAALALPGARAGAVAVRTIHNTFFWHFWPRLGRWCDRRLAAASVACVSEAVCEDFWRYRRDSGAPTPGFSPIVIYNGVDLPPLPPRSGPLRESVRRVLFAGRFEDQKGTDVLCDALPLVSLPADTRGELLLVGRGTHEAQLRRLQQHPPSGWTIELRPPVPTIEPLLANTDLVVQPSRFEGLSLVAIEAALAGVPVVATDGPGVRETLPGDYPWRAAASDARSLAEALSVALADTGRWSAATTSAQQFAREHFSVSIMRRSYADLYRTVLQAS